jgi:putative hydrolase of the HAD superfamily
MNYIKGLLDGLTGIKPIPTGQVPKLSADNSIKAVVFDIYGTLLVSSSGDVDQAEMNTRNLAIALEASKIDVVEKNNALEHILHDFEYTIEICHQEAKRNDIPYPEIDILSIWEIVLLHARRKKLVAFNGDANIMRMTVVFEFLSNKVYPMPGMKYIIEKLSNKGFPLGIVSNAQFYTPVIMNYFLNSQVGLEEYIGHFDPDLTVFSYQQGRGKPDTILFEELVPILHKKYGLQPNEVLFVGNDMLKDIYASSRIGFKTALFAGDQRSLRLRADDDRIKELNPDYVLTELKQLEEILNL